MDKSCDIEVILNTECSTVGVQGLSDQNAFLNLLYQLFFSGRGEGGGGGELDKIQDEQVEHVEFTLHLCTHVHPQHKAACIEMSTPNHLLVAYDVFCIMQDIHT